MHSGSNETRPELSSNENNHQPPSAQLTIQASTHTGSTRYFTSYNTLRFCLVYGQKLMFGYTLSVRSMSISSDQLRNQEQSVEQNHQVSTITNKFSCTNVACVTPPQLITFMYFRGACCGYWSAIATSALVVVSASPLPKMKRKEVCIWIVAFLLPQWWNRDSFQSISRWACEAIHFSKRRHLAFKDIRASM